MAVSEGLLLGEWLKLGLAVMVGLVVGLSPFGLEGFTDGAGEQS